MKKNKTVFIVVILAVAGAVVLIVVESMLERWS